jgi:predicted nucleotidyltransferase
MVEENLDVDEIRRIVKPILEEENVVKAEVFGSYAREEQSKESDIDFLVEFEGDKTLIDIANLRKKLEKALGREVDVLTYNSVKDNMQHIYDEAVEI